MSKDVKMLLVAAVGIGFFAWGLTYASQFGQLVSSTTTGYGNVVRALEPSTMGGNVGANTSLAGFSGSSPGMLA